MRIIIAGAGEVGSHLAKMLSDEDRDIIVIDNEERKLFALDSYNLKTSLGECISFKTLRNNGVNRCELFIAVTPYETRNLLACSIAKSMGAKKTVARIDNYEFLKPEYADYFKGMGVDTLIYPELFAAEEIATALKHNWVRNWFELFDGQLIVAAVKLRASSPMVGKKLMEIGAGNSFVHFNAIRRNGEILIPRGVDRVMENDVVYITTTRDYLPQVVELCGKKKVQVKKMLIMGGSPIAVQVAKELEKTDIKVKIIEPDDDRCAYLVDVLPHCKIIHGDATDSDIMEEEAGGMDAFAALSDRSETNILSCLMSKEYGVRKTIAEVENIQFVHEAERLNIGTIINKKLLASSRIFQMLLDSEQDNARCLALADAEVAEVVIKEGSKLCTKDIKDFDIPAEFTLAGLVRNGEGMLVKGNTRLQAGDHVVVFCMHGSFHKVEKFFKK
ncbi:MAG: Trk system potassium transporter TrkA [Bacteroidales bacterium]|nr:Trk system potassium transporter TrkA [Bacteroidales bacterium]